jgi:transcriptional regulator with XRE-family HTH domain
MTYIKQIRLENNLTRKEMADILKIAYNNYLRCERGELNVSLKSIRKLKEKFKNIDANKFL